MQIGACLVLAVCLAACHASAASAQPDAGATRHGATPGKLPGARGEGAGRRAQQDLEAVVLQALLAPMLQSGSGGKVFGTGPAGKHWQAMMAETIARQLAASGNLNLLGGRPGARPGSGRRTDGARPGIPSCSPACAAPEAWQTTVRSAQGPLGSRPWTGERK